MLYSLGRPEPVYKWKDAIGKERERVSAMIARETGPTANTRTHLPCRKKRTTASFFPESCSSDRPYTLIHMPPTAICILLGGMTLEVSCLRGPEVGARRCDGMRYRGACDFFELLGKLPLREYFCRKKKELSFACCFGYRVSIRSYLLFCNYLGYDVPDSILCYTRLLNARY